MSNAKHTPGPWKWTGHARGLGVKTEAGTEVGIVWYSYDAMLIAAAPELLAAARAALDEIENVACSPAAYGMPIENPDHPWHVTVMQLRAAIAKAEGRA